MKSLTRGAFAPTCAFALCLFSVQPALPFSQSKKLSKTEFSITTRAMLDIKKPGYLNLTHDPVTDLPHLLVSSFQAFGKDNLFSITNWDKGLSQPNQLDLATLNDQIVWPNEARHAAPRMFNATGLIVSGGFLVPGKSTGAITFVPWDHPTQQLTLTTAKKGWYYHRAEDWDVNGDGYLDIITARGTIPMTGKPDGEMIWLENPGPRALETPWKEHFIARGPDVHFRILNNPNHTNSAAEPLTIIAAEFSTRRLTAFRQTTSGTFDSYLLDDTLGAAFDIQVEDLNADGRRELLVTNHEPDAKASVFAYEFDDSELKITRRHTLLTGIETRQRGIKQASPGTVLAFYPTQNSKAATRKPWVLVSGDGSQRAHLLVPTKDSDSNDWSYAEHEIWNARSTVGQSTVGDLDGDGTTEILVPAYDTNKVAVFTIVPPQAPLSPKQKR